MNGLDIKQQELYNLAGIVGSVFQNPRSQFFSVDTDGEVVFGPENIGLSKSEILSRKKQVVQELNLNDLLGRSLFDLSGGENKRLPVHRWQRFYRTSSFWMSHPQTWIGRQS